MCGIVALWDLSSRPIDERLLTRMTDRIAHRGPDGAGYHRDGGVGLGHRRLAIIDLSPAGAQPMASADGAVVITYNGELYNFQKLRSELEALGHRFVSRSDTEVVLEAYLEWGEQCVHRFNGMFAFAVWDRRQRRLWLARDRYGIKPLYWFFDGRLFACASEIKALLAHPRISKRVCHPALNEYFTFQNIFTDLTLFEGVRLLPPGSTLTVTADAGPPAISRYWTYPRGQHLELSEEECAARLSDLFVDAVTRQLMSDVPVGSYLSGGMDSGSITAVAARHIRRLTTFTGGFDLTSASGLELGFDERPAAELLSNLFKTEHYEVVMHAGDMEAVLPQLVWHLEDLRVGQSYPNYYVARLASKFVKVTLSGAGGDELFAGYPWRYFRDAAGGTPESHVRRYYDFWQRLVPDEDKASLFNDATRRAIGAHSTFDVFRQTFGESPGALDTAEDCVEAALAFELKTFLHGLLVVEDKLSMAHGLETRVPFLDDDLVDFAVRIPVRYKLRNLGAVTRVDENLPGKQKFYERQSSDGKAILRLAMTSLIPPEIATRAKQGFTAPDASWFRGESIDYINRLLRDPRARVYEFLEPRYVDGVLDQHCRGLVNRRLLIWSLLSFEWWLRTMLDGDAPPTRAA